MTSITPFHQESWAEESLLTIMLGGGRPAEKANSLCINLPPDLLLEICRHVEDIRTLKNLRLVNTIFAEFAMPALFNEVMFMLHPASIRKLRNIARSPNICKHVRHFTYITDRFRDPYEYLSDTGANDPLWTHPKRKAIAIWSQFYESQRTLLEYNQESLNLLWVFQQFQRIDYVSLLLFCGDNDSLERREFPGIIRRFVAATELRLEDLFCEPDIFEDGGDDPLDATLDAMALSGRPFECFELSSWNPDLLRNIDRPGCLRSYRPLLEQPLKNLRSLLLQLNEEEEEEPGLGASTTDEKLMGLKEILMIPTKLEFLFLDVSIAYASSIYETETSIPICINTILSNTTFPHLKELMLQTAEVDVQIFIDFIKRQPQLRSLSLVQLRLTCGQDEVPGHVCKSWDTFMLELTSSIKLNSFRWTFDWTTVARLRNPDPQRLSAAEISLLKAIIYHNARRMFKCVLRIALIALFIFFGGKLILAIFKHLRQTLVPS